MAEQEAKLVVYAALAGNVAIAVVKGLAAAVSGSGSMASEAVHSLVDSLDQVLLLVGEARGARPPDASHPFGHGLETYFWSFTVALMVFLLGGAASVAEGVWKLLHPGEGGSAALNYGVLAVSAVFESVSLVLGLKQYRAITKGRVGVAAFVRRSKDPNLFVTLMEDSAALIGLGLAALGVTGEMLGLAWADGAASLAIGVLLVAVAAVLANETRSLIAGEAADRTVVDAVREALDACPHVSRTDEVATLQLGPKTILVAVTLELADGAGAMEAAAEAIAAHVRGIDERIARVYFRPPGAVDVAPKAAQQA